MIDPDRLRRLRGHFHTGEIPIARPDCLNDDTIAALAEGTLGGEARARALIHMATCVFCRHSVASLTSALADGPITHEIEAVERRSRSHRMLWFTLPLAAAAAVLVVLFQRENADQLGIPILRDSVGSDTAAHAPILIAPRTAVARVEQFVWLRVPRADRYRVRLYNEEGDVLWTTETADTAVAIPDAIDLAPRISYFWRVEAQSQWQKWTASDLVEFRLAERSR